MYYHAIFEPDASGGFTVTFPDLPGCITEGDDEQQALAMAADALDGHVQTLKDLGMPVPPPSPHAAVRDAAPAGTLVFPVPLAALESRQKRVNITMGERLLSHVDRAAKTEGMTRSGFLAAAARDYLDRLTSA
ncbi:type II toxin-antitoxin system HicB family antitoxin [Desulfolutivibrio sulfoxidireducens]|uniref:type II toxin-antitoxin system HicB family antitoxin n=1 Tax=Desulfolutivibrio sulfoxidireducens TaxID=2773299 RepID=UPI00159D958F|nr:type II toxin-antitoxin system HicB family antitoxin [Desulfolutivibrio sulfoxidireducens]QLA18787.1 ribbon-helix-helix protein, CopG family [Desulfolutivibrio sulfoxidireducens]